MKLKILRTILVGGYGNTPVQPGSVVAPTTLEEAEQLVEQGYAEKVSDKTELTLEQSHPLPSEGEPIVSTVSTDRAAGNAGGRRSAQ